MKSVLDYVLVKHDFFTKKECDEAIQELEEKGQFEPHRFYDANTDKSGELSGSQELDVGYCDINLTNKIMEKMPKAIESYMLTANTENYWNNYTGFSIPRYNKYIKNKKMAWHVDHIYSLFDGSIRGVPILSCLFVLNDNFTGGEFILFENTQIKVKQGDLLIFPSNFMYPHRVEPVTEGIRWTAISWIY